MDEAIKKKKHRLAYAVKIKDTSTQWDLIAAGVEEGVIECFELEGKEATKMKGRSRITFNKKSKRLLKSIEAEDSNADLATRAGWLRTVAGHHIKLANTLINVARTTKSKTSSEANAKEKHKRNKWKEKKEDIAKGSKAFYKFLKNDHSRGVTVIEDENGQPTTHLPTIHKILEHTWSQVYNTH
jgi:tRNA threonylcarbamoyladenosine modification (KEOPS) complex  Pcc1 subunit